MDKIAPNDKNNKACANNRNKLVSDEHQRILVLEEQIAHLTKQNEELSNEIHAQWRQFDRLKQEMLSFRDKLQTLEFDTNDQSSAIIHEKPPHW